MSSICDDLRAAILQAAMQGKLTEQLPEDGDAEELLAKIISKKEALIKSGSIRCQPVTKKILKDDAPFTIPDSWKWVRVGDLGLLESGFSFKSSDYGERGIQVVRISDLGENEILTKNAVYCPDDPSLAKYEIKKYSILICLTGSIGKMALVTDDQKRYLNQRVGMYSLYEKSILDFLWRILHAENIKFDWISHKTSTNGNIKNEVVLNTLVPLPPVAEQKRIVEKIDELMARVADLEKSADALASLKKSFPSDVRDALLQAAMQGKLTEQLPEDGDAGELLEQIKVEKEKLVAEGKIKKQKPLAPIVNDEIPFEIPGNWKWVRLWDLFQFINGDRGKNYPSKDKLYASGEIPFISAINMYNGTVRKDNLLYADKMTYDRLGSGKLNENDFAICIRGSLGKYCKYPYKIGAIASSLVIMRKYSELILDDYIDMYLRSPLLVSEIHEKNNGTAQPNLSAAVFASFLIPIPPLAEQKRIADCLNSLISNINTIEGLTASE